MVEQRDESTAAADARLLAGGPVDFGYFYASHEDFVLRLFLQRRVPAEVAADMAAETFARALAGRGRFDATRGDGRGWLTGIARHVLAESVRIGHAQDRVCRRMSIERLELDDNAIWRINELADERALSALESLPDDQRMAVRGRVVEEQDYEHLARRLGCSESVARKRVSRGIASLRTRLEQPR